MLVKKLAQGFNTAAQDSNPGPISRGSDALPLSYGAMIHVNNPDSKPTLAQRWPNYGTVGLTLALGEQCWANVGPTMYRQHKFQVNLV